MSSSWVILFDFSVLFSFIFVVLQGCYLPLTAVLGGLLWVIPGGYQEAERDVIRLSADVGDLQRQQGRIMCEALPPSQGGPLHPVPLHLSLRVTLAQVRRSYASLLQEVWPCLVVLGKGWSNCPICVAPCLSWH